MTIKVPLPGDNWAELREADDLTGADQDDWYGRIDDLRAARTVPGLPERPDPANPAVMLPAQPSQRAELTSADNRALKDLVLKMTVVSWSLPYPLPVTAETSKALPLRVRNALNRLALPVQDALNGADEDEDEDGPKPAAPTGTGGSADTSGDGTENPLPESAGEPSGTPQG